MKRYDSETIEFAQAEESKIKVFNLREHRLEDDRRGDDRDDYRRDYARVLYSSSFRRLQGKMQLLGIDHTHFYRNRLTHSLEVAQIAGSIARDLELKNPIVTETCSLVHDLGNPPFGHAGEKILNKLAHSEGEIGGYEGNAQAFRILRHLEKKHPKYPGLNLTIRTLFGITKYFQKKDENPKQPNKFLYDEDYEFLQHKMQDRNVILKKSIDAQIMDLADEIAYAAHDLEDALKSGLLTVQELMYEFQISDKYKESEDRFNIIANDARKLALTANRLETSEEYSFIMRKEITSSIVHSLMKDIGVTEADDSSRELGFQTLRNLSLGLKKLVFEAISRKKDVFLYEKQGERVIKGLFEVYMNDNFNKDLSLLPPELKAIYRNNKSEDLKKRLVIDYIAGMMDSFALKEYSSYFGASSLDKIYEKNIFI
jgi:dGTPase